MAAVIAAHHALAAQKCDRCRGSGYLFEEPEMWAPECPVCQETGRHPDATL